MHELTVFGRHREYCPPGTCSFGFGIGEAALATSLLAAGAEVGAVGAAVTATTALAPAAFAIPGVLAGIPLAAAAPGAIGAIGAATGILGTGIGLAEIGQVASLGGTLLSAKSGMDQAEYQAALGRAEAAAQKQRANDEAGAGQRVAITRERQTELVMSRARALAAASGTDATSPDIVDNEADIAGQGRYNALSALYEGQSRARTSNYQAEIDLFRSNRVAAAAPWAAGGTLLSGISSFADRRLRRNYLLGGSGA